LKRTGIFFLYLIGERLSDFPAEFAGILNRDNISFYEAFYEIPPTPYELLLKVHSPAMIEGVKRTPYYETALYSTGGTVLAADKIKRDEIDNAFVFTGTGDHHAGRDYFGGGCHFNGAALAIAHLRAVFGGGRYAILDTDCHHGDGTRDIFSDDRDVLHVCFCSYNYDDGTNVDIAIPYSTNDSEYLSRLEEEFVPRVVEFKPEIIFWEFGYDATSGDYGSKGLSVDCHARIAEIVNRTADEVCQGRAVAILCGGSRRDTARYCIPEIINRLSES
jgi:acetoin utilization deacetylase AcuC-like enzyme